MVERLSSASTFLTSEVVVKTKLAMCVEHFTLSQHSPNSTYYYHFIFQIFIWIGKDANEVEKSESLKSGKLDINYSEKFKFTYILHRNSKTSIIVIT